MTLRYAKKEKKRKQHLKSFLITPSGAKNPLLLDKVGRNSAAASITPGGRRRHVTCDLLEKYFPYSLLFQHLEIIPRDIR